MSDGRTVWLAKDSGWWRREAVIEMLGEVGPTGPAVVDWLACEAKAQNQGGMVKTGYRVIAHSLFIDLVTVRPIVSLGVRVGLLDDWQEDGRTFTCRISGWKSEQERALAASRKARQRAAAQEESPAPGLFSRTDAAAGSHGVSRLVTPRPKMSPTGQDRTEELPPVAPQGGPLDIPVRPASRRKRELDAYHARVEEYALSLLPSADPKEAVSVVRGALGRCRSTDAVLEHVRQWRPELLGEAAA